MIREIKELDITLYINSHSPIFIESMDAFIEFYGMENEVIDALNNNDYDFFSNLLYEVDEKKILELK